MIAAEFVLDASFAIPWIFRDEANPLSDKAWKKLIAENVTAHVPGLWPIEMVNVALRGPRGKIGKLSEEDVAEFFTVVRSMPLRVHHQSLESLLDRAPALMQKHGLTAYDSSYLMLAMGTGFPLATRDKALQQAALAEGVGLVE